jgi:hypothetical protein
MMRIVDPTLPRYGTDFIAIAALLPGSSVSLESQKAQSKHREKLKPGH